MQPRIYTYKITFEEVPYYYYGAKKEKYFNQKYFGSPITNKWCWELYTPKKQILEIFDYTDAGYIKALEVEKRLITHFLNDKWCLNENVGGVMSITSAKKGGEKCRDEKIGIFSYSKKQLSNNGKKAGKKVVEEKKGFHSFTKEQRVEVGNKTKDLKKGIFAYSKEQLSVNGKKGGSIGGKISGKITSSQRWMCLETGFVSTPGPLSRYQKKQGIDTSKRKRIA
jgi:hypothetical protein